jgi:hypothetical protein
VEYAEAAVNCLKVDRMKNAEHSGKSDGVTQRAKDNYKG